MRYERPIQVSGGANKTRAVRVFYHVVLVLVLSGDRLSSRYLNYFSTKNKGDLPANHHHDYIARQGLYRDHGKETPAVITYRL